jgi:hypothetical protein
LIFGIFSDNEVEQRWYADWRVVLTGILVTLGLVGYAVFWAYGRFVPRTEEAAEATAPRVGDVVRLPVRFQSAEAVGFAEFEVFAVGGRVQRIDCGGGAFELQAATRSGCLVRHTGGGSTEGVVAEAEVIAEQPGEVALEAEGSFAAPNGQLVATAGFQPQRIAVTGGAAGGTPGGGGDSNTAGRAGGQPSRIAGIDVTHPSGALVRLADDVTIWLLDGGERRYFRTPTEYLSHDFRWEEVILISPEEMQRYPAAGYVGIRGGTLVRDPADNAVYVVHEETRRPVDWTAARFGGYTDGHVVDAQPGEMAAYALADAAAPDAYFANTLLRAAGAEEIYRLTAVGGGLVRAPVSTFGVFLSHGWSFADVIDVPDAVLARWPAGETLYYREGALLSADDRDIYAMEDGKKRYFPDRAAFIKYGYDERNVIRLQRDELAAIPEGAPL